MASSILNFLFSSHKSQLHRIYSSFKNMFNSLYLGGKKVRDSFSVKKDSLAWAELLAHFWGLMSLLPFLQPWKHKKHCNGIAIYNNLQERRCFPFLCNYIIKLNSSRLRQTSLHFTSDNEPLSEVNNYYVLGKDEVLNNSKILFNLRRV